MLRTSRLRAAAALVAIAALAAGATWSTQPATALSQAILGGMPEPTAPRRGYAGRSAEERRAERRERLIQAGFELFGGDGYLATSIEKLCAAANLSTRNFYQEFASREALLIALHDRITQQALLAAAEALAEAAEEPFATRVARAVRAYLGVTSSDPRWTRIAYVELLGVSAPVEQHRLAWRERVCAFLEAEASRAAQRGEATERDFHYTAIALIGAVNELVSDLETHGRRVSLDTICDEITRLIVAAATAP